MDFVVTGPFRVAGVEPGGIVTAAELEGANIDHLVAAGHLVPNRPAKAEQATTTPDKE